MKSLTVLLAGVQAAAAATLPLPSSNCRNITFVVKASASNLQVDQPSNSDLSSSEGVSAYLQALPATVLNSTPRNRSGTFNLAAVYCNPWFPAKPFLSNSAVGGNPPLQILVHGATYTKEYWNHGAWSDANSNYSWTSAASNAGYATLAIDKLGNGASSHPDPVLDVQLPLQMETIHAIITQLRNGLSLIPRPKTIIFVGHASGSSLGALLAETYPKDADALVLTGYSSGSSINQSLLQAQEYAPAAISDPQRFGNLSYGYLLPGSLAARTSTLYYEGHYDPSIPEKDFATRGVQALGERFNTGPKSQPSYKGKILVVTGSNDQVVCGANAARQCSLVPDAVMNVNATFPSSTGFEYYIPQTGRNVNWHYKALTTFDVTFQKLDYLLGRSSAGWRIGLEQNGGQ